MASAIPENDASFTLAEVAALTSGTLAGSGEVRVRGVVTDSRVSAAGKLFIALPGERYDGHAFVTAALRAGAQALLVERNVGELGVPTVRVESSYAALGKLAQAHRERWPGRLVAVAGSAGKTTTRSAISTALESVAEGAVHFVPGNLNNRVGVPSVLLGLSARHRCAVVEIGTNALGEVHELCQLARPDVAVLTLIGLEHTEGLGSLSDIEAEEGSLFTGLRSHAVAIGNADDVRVARQLAAANVAHRSSYGFAESADYRVLERTPSPRGGSRVVVARPSGAPLALDCPLVGRAGATALAAAIAASEACTGQALNAEALGLALQRLGIGEAGRLTPVVLADGTFLLDDSYNSNPASLPSSVAAAAELARARSARLVLVLGEMRELGEESPRLHRESGQAVVDAGASLVVGVSGDARWLLEPFEKAGVNTHFAQDAEVAARVLEAQLAPGDVVLVKASRGVRAERVVEKLIASRGRAE
jgi:UDP-N-acetylmuramoyl-tripeptide--D-alanyl-D-alanine ligase